MSFLPSIEPGAVLMNVFKAFPKTSKPLLEFHEALLRGPSPLSGAERELIAAFVSAKNRCRYCSGAHTATAEVMGIEVGTVARLIDDIEESGVDERMKPILRYVAKLTDQPDSLTRADADAVFAAGWDEQALHDAVLTCALFNLMNRYVEGLGIEADPKYFDQAAERLSKTGYASMIKTLGIG
ncbi:MAG: peroxidase-related enzyme [Alphaproteobacteria bacterium]|nr:peroxidase-related enzyme [Alphaproteobacteria bacterium]